MKLYHGTTSARLSSILQEGIKPRGLEWEGNFSDNPSMPGFVYLSAANPMRFATQAACATDNSDDKALIFEVDTDLLPDKFYPDEDYLRDVAARIELYGKPMDAWSTDIYRMRREWKHSLGLIGSVAFRGRIPIRAITRYATVEFWRCPSMCEIAMRFGISSDFYGVMGDWYRDFVRMIFDGIPMQPMIYPTLPDFSVADQQKAIDWVDSYNAIGIKAFSERAGAVEICQRQRWKDKKMAPRALKGA